MKIQRIIVILILAMSLAACKSTVVDASTYDKMTSSFKDMLSSLPDEERKQFFNAYSSIIYSYQNHVAFRDKGDTREVIQKRLNSKIGGMNASQILDEYKKVKKKRALWDIQEIEKNLLKGQDSDKQLSLVTIDSYKLYLGKDGYLDRIFLDAVIKNNSKYKLSSAVFLLRVGSSYSDTLLPPQRNIYIEFPSGLESGHEVMKKIDLGYPSSQRYLPKEPILAEQATSRITGDGIDISANRYPTISVLEQSLKKAKKYFEDEFQQQ